MRDIKFRVPVISSRNYAALNWIVPTYVKLVLHIVTGSTVTTLLLRHWVFEMKNLIDSFVWQDLANKMQIWQESCNFIEKPCKIFERCFARINPRFLRSWRFSRTIFANFLVPLHRVRILYNNYRPPSAAFTKTADATALVHWWGFGGTSVTTGGMRVISKPASKNINSRV